MSRSIILSRKTSVKIVSSKNNVLNRKPFHSVSRKIQHRPRSFEVSKTFMDTTYYVGKYITLFTLFYTSLNWMMYKNIREQNEKENENDDETKSK